jgi:hypothetical protein
MDHLNSRFKGNSIIILQEALLRLVGNPMLLLRIAPSTALALDSDFNQDLYLQWLEQTKSPQIETLGLTKRAQCDRLRHARVEMPPRRDIYVSLGSTSMSKDHDVVDYQDLRLLGT